MHPSHRIALSLATLLALEACSSNAAYTPYPGTPYTPELLNGLAAHPPPAANEGPAPAAAAAPSAAEKR